MQPVYRCEEGGPFLARWGNDTDGCPQNFPNVTSILGDGALGAHGGSGLSSVGGTIRLGELLPDSPPIRHALKLEFDGRRQYFGGPPLQNASHYNGGRTQYMWPATGSDSCSKGAPHGCYTGKDPRVAPGALLALPRAVATGLTMATVIGRQIRDALASYGAYLVDSTGNYNMVAVCQLAEVNLELRKAYGFSMAYPDGVQAGQPGLPGKVYDDLLLLMRNLHAVVNNAPGATAGGGSPLAPMAPPICE